MVLSVLESWLETMASVGYTSAFTAVVLIHGVTGSPVPQDRFNLVAEATEMLPPEWQTPLKASDIKRILESTIPEKAEPSDVVPADWSVIMKGTASEEQYVSVFRPRTKTDMSIRRTRMHDCAALYRKHSKLDEWQQIVDHCRRWGWDYIACANLANFNWALSDAGFSWWHAMTEVGCLPGSLTTYMARSRKLSDLLKTRPCTVNRFRLMECAGVSGYRNPPMPGFDVFKEAKLLAQGEYIPHDAYTLKFKEVAAEALRMHIPPVAWIDLWDFIRSGEWLTTGSSSIGMVEWSYDGESGSFKARKNMVVHVVSGDELCEYVKGMFGKQTNRTIVKAELGKMRLAVAGDLATYLMMTWINRLLGGAYVQWPGSTIEEDLPQMSDRLIDMLSALASGFGLPFDYKGFDHQPTTAELIVIIEQLIAHARNNVPTAHIPHFEWVCQGILLGMRHAQLITRDGDETQVLDVEGGLMSGLRWTSTVGNAWNTVVTSLVLKALGAVGIDTMSVKRWIRGDDSAIVTPSWAAAYLVRMGYQGASVEAGDGKFSIWKGQCEFLRQWFDQRVYGYAPRSLPGWLQRKPWASAPWKDSAVMDALADLRELLIRRGCSAERVWAMWNNTAEIWCRHTRVSRRWLQLPKCDGGLGLEPWRGWRSDKAWPAVQVVSITIKNATEWAERAIMEEVKVAGVQASPETIRLWADRRRSQLIATDDIPGLMKPYRDAWKDAFHTLKNRWVYERATLMPPLWEDRVTVVSAMRPEKGALAAIEAELTRPNGFGYGRKALQDWRTWSELSRYEKVRPVQLLHERYPDVWALLKELEHHGLTRQQALSWVMADIQWPNFGANPIVRSLVEKAALSLIGDPKKRRWRAGEWVSTVYHYWQWAEKQVTSSLWYNTLFLW